MGAVSANLEADYKDTRLELARSLVQKLEHGDEKGVEQAIGELTRGHESHLFQEIGKLTRELHDSMGFCRGDERIASLSQQEFPDARERLNYVITKTEDSANRTLDIIENLLPVSDALAEQAGDLQQAWQRFVRREMSVDEFRELSARLEKYLGTVGSHAQKIKQDLSDIIMAQDYQDLTGQIIRQVINLVQEVEDKLVNVIRSAKRDIAPPKEKPERDIKAEGPQINKEDDPNVMSGQDEVDDLLSSLGF